MHIYIHVFTFHTMQYYVPSTIYYVHNKNNLIAFINRLPHKVYQDYKGFGNNLVAINHAGISKMRQMRVHTDRYHMQQHPVIVENLISNNISMSVISVLPVF